MNNILAGLLVFCASWLFASLVFVLGSVLAGLEYPAPRSRLALRARLAFAAPALIVMSLCAAVCSLASALWECMLGEVVPNLKEVYRDLKDAWDCTP